MPLDLMTSIHLRVSSLRKRANSSGVKYPDDAHAGLPPVEHGVPLLHERRAPFAVIGAHVARVDHRLHRAHVALGRVLVALDQAALAGGEVYC